MSTYLLWNIAATTAGMLCVTACCMCPSVDPPPPSPKPAVSSESRPGMPDQSAIENLNNTCADVWCEGAVDFWSHELRCKKKSGACRVRFTARVPDNEWRRFGRKLPRKRVKNKMPRKWRVGARGPRLDEITYPELPAVLIDDKMKIPATAFYREGAHWYLSDEGYEIMGKKLRGWRPPR